MKFECNINATAPTIFSEQLSNVIELFQQWNDCERAVMLFAVLKKLPFPITKFLQSVIDTSLQQAQCKEQAKTLERNANCAKYINSLSETYKSFKYNDTQLTTDSIFFESDRSIDNIIDKYYDKKEEILHDILKMMPILTIGNDEAKLAYLEFIPMTVSDATRRIVSSTLVQQIFCYVLIHPAFSTEDRSSVVKYLKDLEAHISSNEPNFFLYRNGSSPTSEPTNPSTPSNWQAIAPPQSKSTETIPSSWGSSHHLTRGYVDDTDYRNQPAPSSSPQLGHFFERSSDDPHKSFLRNGKIVNDVDDTNKSNTQLGFVTLPGVTKHLFSPDGKQLMPLDMENTIWKTKRSNSLTTTGLSTRTPSTQNSSNEKQRSASLSTISTLTLNGYEFELKPTSSTGMSNIGQWLKSLRLHKYVYLFANQTYEQMLDITEENLIQVTKGARTKLANCIQKLKERYDVLCQVEEDLLCGHITMKQALDELSNIVLTPMKPIEPCNKQDVASQFLKVLDLVSTKMTAKHIVPQDEEYINTLMWILEKSLHNEAFVARTNLLREHRYNVQRIKNQFPSKSHYSKNNTSATTSSSNIHRQRPRTIKLNDYLPTNQSLFTGIKRSTPNIDPIISYSDAAKSFDAKYYDSMIYGGEQRTDDTLLFKIPQTPPPPTPRKMTFRGSVESISSSGYQSDGYYPIDGTYPVGMGNIRQWLKSLRLHKYTYVFNNISYEKMFTMTEEYLKGLNITQGASRKLATCIEKLTTRCELLKKTELCLTQNPNRLVVAEAIKVMESIVPSPMKPMRYQCDTDPGYRSWQVLGLLFNQLIMNNYDEQTIQTFQRVIDSSLNSEAFTDYQYSLKDMKIKLGRLGKKNLFTHYRF